MTVEEDRAMWLTRICLTALLLLSATGHAQAPAATAKTEHDKARARDAFRQATHFYDFGEYDKALESFKEAYTAYEDPSFLFNIAQCHRQLGQTEEALRVYRSYLRNAQNPPNAEEVRQLIARLEKTLETEKQNRQIPPEGTVPPESPATTTNEPPPPQLVPPPVTTTAVVSRRDDRPLTRKPWFWAVIGGAVVVAGVAVAVGVVEGTKSPANPMPTLGKLNGN